MLGPGEEHGILPSHKWLQLRAALVLQTVLVRGVSSASQGVKVPRRGDRAYN